MDLTFVVDGKAEENDVGIRVRKGAKTVIVLLTSSVPQSQLNLGNPQTPTQYKKRSRKS